MDYIYLLLILSAYLSGSVASAVIITQWLSLPDPRAHGSLNPGTTNVLRIAGFKASLLTLLSDILKTAWPILLAKHFGYSSQELIWIGTAGLLGHCYPIFFSFKGGKGVACLLTLVLLSKPELGFVGLMTWLIAAVGFLRSSAASMIASLAMPAFSHQFYPELFLPLSTLAAIVFIQHKKNIANIIQGKEPIIGKVDCDAR